MSAARAVATPRANAPRARPRSRTAADSGDRRVRVAVTRGDVGEVELRAIVALTAREQLGEALLGLLVVAGVVGQQRQAAVDLRLWRAVRAQPLEFLVGLLAAIQRGKDLCQLKPAALGIGLFAWRAVASACGASPRIT